jgi:PAS domain S-box-containing protein
LTPDADEGTSIVSETLRAPCLPVMNIRTKLILGLGLVLVLTLGVGLYAVQSYKEVTARISQTQDLSSHIVASALTAQVHFKKQVQEWKNVLLRGHEPELYDKYLRQFYDEERETRAAMQTLAGLLAPDSEAGQTAQTFLRAHVRLGREYRDALKYFREGAQPPHIAVDTRVRGIDREPTDLLDSVVELTRAHKKEQLARIAGTVEQLEQHMLLGVIGVVTGVIALLIWWSDRSIGRPIAAATAVARRISDGNLSSTIVVKGRDEAAELLKAMRTMQQSLAEFRRSLRESEERTRLLLDSAGEGIYGVDTEGRCIFCNPAGVEMLGYPSAAELLGRDMHSLMHHTRTDGTPYPAEACQATETLRTGRAVHVDDEVFWRPDGTSFPVEYRSHPIYRGERLIGAVVNFADIAERRQAEAALQNAHETLARERVLLARRVEERTEELALANAELARSARAKDEFLASMSHELRTPLTAILGISEALADQVYGDLTKGQTKAVTTIEESATHLLDLINDILDVAKVEAGRMELTWDQVPVAELCEASLRLIQQSARRKGLTVEATLDPAVRIVPGDSRRLKQVLVNLLSNAVKFTADGGQIGLEVAGDAAAGRARFTVWDTGIGIPKGQLDKLFRPFVQLDNKLSRQHSGTGLGLALVYRMTGLHGGRVDVRSTPGKGSRFSVLLPWSQDAPGIGHESLQSDRSTRAADRRAQNGGAMLLIAEDNQDTRAMLCDYLQHMGFRVLPACDGAEAVTAAAEHRPDLALMDIQMPGMDGLEAIERIRGIPPLSNVPIIALTALAMPGDRERCLEAGADEYLSKPVGLKELRRAIEARLR